MLERPGLRKEKKEKKTVWKRFTQKDQPKPDKNKGNQSKTGSKSGTTTSKPNQEEASKSGQAKQTKTKNKRESKSIDDILEGGKETTNNAGVAKNFEKTLEDFEALQLSNVKDIQTQYGLGKVGYLEDGTLVVARPGSKTGGPTLEIKVSNKKIYKIRY